MKAEQLFPTQTIPLKRFLFYRLQFFFYAALTLCVGTGVICLQIVAESPKATVALTALFVMMAILVATSQLLIQYRLLSRVCSPLQRTIQIFVRCAEDMQRMSHETFPFTTVQTTLSAVDRTMAPLSRHSPREVHALRAALVDVLSTLERAWSQISAQSTLLAMGQVCRQVAHDMRSPVAVIRTGLRHVQQEVALAGDGKAIVEAGLRSCEQLHAMAEELLDFNRAQAVQPTELDMAQLIQAVTAALCRPARQHGIAVEFHGPATLSARGDAAKLTRVVQNLVQNAVQAMDGQATGDVRVALEPKNETVIIHIDDTGPGIPPAHLANLFSYQFTTKGNKGTGLGLLYCHEVIKAHGGRLTVANREPCGTRFTITLPNPVVQ